MQDHGLYSILHSRNSTCIVCGKGSDIYNFTKNEGKHVLMHIVIGVICFFFEIFNILLNLELKDFFCLSF